MTATRIQRMFAVNVTGVFRCAREAVRRMSTRHGHGGGAIVNVSSRAAVLGSAGEYVDHAAAKAAVDALTIGLAAEVAAAIAWLLGEEASYVTGAFIDVSGGR